MKLQTKLSSLFLIFIFVINYAQQPLFKRVLISDVGLDNSIGNANTSRNLAITNSGIIYAVYTGSEGIRVSKSINQGESFLPSIQISPTQFTEPEIAVNSQGDIFVSWVEFGNIFFSRSIDEGVSFSSPLNIGTAISAFAETIHMSTFGNNVYIRDASGVNLYINSNNGLGSFNNQIISVSEGGDVFADVRTDINGVVHLPSDDPTLYLFNSTDQGSTFREVELSPRGSVFFSSYALSDSPSGTFIFVAGSGDLGYKIDAETGISTPINFKPNNSNQQGRTLFADNFGALVDGYFDAQGNIKMSISYDQGVSFDLDIIIDNAISHSIERNPLTDDLDVIYQRNGQIFMDVFDGLLRSVKILNPNEVLKLCQGDTSDIEFTLSGSFLNNSEFLLFLSDETGNFDNQTQIASLNSNSSGEISFTIPQNIISSSNYRLQIQSPSNFLQSNIIPIEIGSTIEISTIDNVRRCATGSETAAFNLLDIDNLIPENNNGTTTSYFENENDALLNINPISDISNYVSNSKTIWVRLNDTRSNQCPTLDIAPINLEVIPLPQLNSSITDLKVCDNSNSGSDNDGIVIFNLNIKIEEILGSDNSADFEIDFFTDSLRLNRISNPNNFTNTVANRQIIYVSVTNKNEVGCIANTKFDVVVTPLTNLLSNSVVLKQCDDDIDGISFFNLNEANKLLSSNFENEIFKYYESASLAESGVDGTEISNPNFYTNLTPTGSIVYVRIINDGNCFITSHVELVVGVSNIPQSFFDDLKVNNCDDGIIENEYTDGITTFDLTLVKKDIDSFFADANAVKTSFYESEENAFSEINRIENINIYRNSTPANQRIYVRVDGVVNNDCVAFGSFDINTTPIPEKKVIPNLIGCGNTTAIFDLTTNENEIIGNQSNIDVFYYDSLANRNLDIPIQNVTNYTSNPRTIYVKAINMITGCQNTDMQFELLVEEVILDISATLKKCSFSVETIFDLTANQIATKNDNLTFEYFENSTDLATSNFIASPKNYLSTELTNTIIIKATNKNGCSSIANLTLETILFTEIDPNITPIKACDTDNDGFEVFDLTLVEDELINNNSLSKSDIIFKYYLTIFDAESNIGNSISNVNTFRNNIKNEQNIFVRIELNSGECYSIISFNIKTIPTPKNISPLKYVLCSEFNNSVSNTNQTIIPQVPISINLSEKDYNFRWFDGTEIREDRLIPLETNANYMPETAGFYSVEIKNKKDELACSSFFTVEVVNSIIPKKITIEQVSNQFSSNNIIEIIVDGEGTFEFSDDGRNWQSNNQFSSVSNGENTYYVRDIFNCSMLTETITIVNYPRFFSPNNDGINDTWNIESSKEIQISTIQIFNRYGKLLKQLNPNSEPWNGEYAGKQLPSDDYWFVLNYNDSSSTQKQIKSRLTLKR